MVIFCLCVVILDLEPEKWDLKLTDESIDKLAPLVGSQSLRVPSGAWYDIPRLGTD